jgi:hypothetical protein
MTLEAARDCLPLPPTVVEAAGRADVTDIPAVLDCLRQIQSGLDLDPGTDTVESLAELHEMTDGLASFNHLYRVITAEIWREYQTRDFFQNKPFLAELDVQFAKRYFDAIATYGQGDCRSRAWQVLIERSDDRRITPMQFAVSGVNTHVNYDLPFAVVATCKRLKTALEAPGQHHDYDQVNTVFFAKIPTLRAHFEERWQQFLDRSVLKLLATQLDNMTVVLDRGLAWETAEHLSTIQPTSAFHRSERSHDAAVALINHALLVPLGPGI